MDLHEWAKNKGKFAESSSLIFNWSMEDKLWWDYEAWPGRQQFTHTSDAGKGFYGEFKRELGIEEKKARELFPGVL